MSTQKTINNEITIFLNSMPGSQEVQIHQDSDHISGFNENSFQPKGNILF